MNKTENCSDCIIIIMYNIIHSTRVLVMLNNNTYVCKIHFLKKILELKPIITTANNNSWNNCLAIFYSYFK